MEQPTPSPATADVVLTFRTGGTMDTKADPTLADAADGGAFHNLLVVITTLGDEDHRQVKRTVFIDSPKIKREQGVDYVTELSISFPKLELGTYHIGAYANIDHTAWQNSDDKLISYKSTPESSTYNTWMWTGAAVDTASNRTSLKTFLSAMNGKYYHVGQRLKELTGTAVPASPEVPMLLTGHDDLNVGVVDYVGTVELLRPVARLKVEVNNYTGMQVTLKELNFSAFNPSTAFLMRYWGANDEPQLPDGVTYRDMPAATADQTIESGAEKALVYNSLVYGSNAPKYKMYAHIKAKVDETTYKDMWLGHHRVIPKTELDAMATGDTKDVLLVNPSSNGGRIFGYSGGNVNTQLKSKTEDDMMKVVASLLSSNNAAAYSLTLTKLATGYSLKLGDNDIVPSGFILDTGNPGSANSISLTDESTVLVRLKTGSNYYYNNNGTISNTSSKPTTHTRQWIFVDPRASERDGSVLKYIDPTTSKVSPLVYIHRNQELTVILNLYYQQEKHTLDFEVVDTDWTSGSYGGDHIFQ